MSWADENVLKTAERAAAKRRIKSNINTNRYHWEIQQIDWDRRNRCKESLLEDIQTYHAAAFHYFRMRLDDDHYKLIQAIEDTLLGRTTQPIVFALPRGSSKSTISICAIDWAVRHGHCRWSMLVTAESESFEKALADIKLTYEHPYTEEKLFTVDFPELCYPARKIARVTQNARGLHYDGVHLEFIWAADRSVFPTTPQTTEFGNAGATISGGGLLSAMRGQRRTTASGLVIRPDAVLADDIETDGSADSVAQVKKRLEVMRSGVKGLSGPDGRLRMLVSGTILKKNSAMHKLMGPEYPEYRPIRVPMIKAWPDDMDLWKQYAEILKTCWIESRPITEALDFYDENQSALDEGCVVYWRDRIIHPYKTAICTALSLWISDPAAFASEYQQDPEDECESSDVVYCEVAEILEKQSTFEQRVVPDDATEIVASADVQGDVFIWGVAAVTEGMRRWVIDYGTWPEQGVKYWTKSNLHHRLSEQWDSPQQAWYEGLRLLMTYLASVEYLKPDGTRLHITRGLVDANYGESTDTMYEVCRDHGEGIWLPAHGVGITAKGKPLNSGMDQKNWRKKYKSHGPYWNRSTDKERRCDKILFDANYAKTQVHLGIRTPHTDPGSLTFHKGEHTLIADHCRAEYPVRTSGRERQLVEWEDRTQKPDNDYLDVLGMLGVAASIQKFCLPGHEKLYTTARARRTISKQKIEERNRRIREQNQ